MAAIQVPQRAVKTAPKAKKKVKKVALENKEELCVMFDLESTGLGTNTAEIVQIAALAVGDEGRGESFNQFILPRVPIHWGATKVHGMRVEEGRLVRRGVDLGAGEGRQVLHQFFLWCSRLQAGRPLLLVAHNGARVISLRPRQTNPSPLV